jgi:hypothetical protein
MACRRWGEGVGGLLSAFPAVVGPVLLILALERGAAFTARAANATLLGLAALAGFVLTYSMTGQHAGWRLSLLAGWACAGAIATALSFTARGLAFPAGLVAAAISLATAYRLMPPSPAGAIHVPMTPARRDIPIRMAATAALVLAAVALLRGMLAGMPCFVGFCGVVALLVVPVGATVAFAAATVAAIALYAAVIFAPQAEAARSASASRT